MMPQLTRKGDIFIKSSMVMLGREFNSDQFFITATTSTMQNGGRTGYFLRAKNLIEGPVNVDEKSKYVIS